MKFIPAICVPLLLVGCTVERTIVQEAKPTTTAPPTTQAGYDEEEMYIDAIYSIYDGPIYSSDRELLETGYITCDALDAGQTIDELLDVINDAASSADTADLLTSIAASAIAWLCPWHRDLVESAGNGV